VPARQEETVPTYQYACTACGERLEAVQTFTDAPLTECRVCDGALRKVFSAVGVVFKGSGFYKTDSRSAQKSGDGKSEGKSEGKAESKSGGDAATSTSSGSSSSGDKGGSSSSGDKGSSGGSGDKGSSGGKAPSTSSTSSTPASKSA
jgi:putative FmdB family regulatory protein